MTRSLFVAAVLAAVLPGSALGAGLVQQRDLQPQASARVLQTRSFELVGLHWRGSGRAAALAREERLPRLVARRVTIRERLL